jgi:hypothetical protein
VRGCPRSPLKKITQDGGFLPSAARASPAGPVLYRDARRRRRAEAGLSEACHEADLGTAAAMEHLLSVDVQGYLVA